MTRLQNFANGTQPAAGKASPAPAPGTPDPQTPGDHFSRSSDSLKRDGFLAATLLGTCTLPYAGTPIGLIGGPLTALSGFSELREGMRNASTRETLNGAAHLAVGGIITACAFSAHPLANAFLVSVGIGTLAVKAFCDSPQSLPTFVAQEGAKLVRDGFQGAADLVNFRPKAQDANKQQ